MNDKFVYEIFSCNFKFFNSVPIPEDLSSDYFGSKLCAYSLALHLCPLNSPFDIFLQPPSKRL